jgi:NADPH:quinone reductase-like Zn-dependent oxidoreductase
MKAIVLNAYGDVDQLQPRELPDPAPGPNQIAVRVAGASINPVDWKLRSGALAALMPLTLPAVLGRDASGVVASVGPGVTDFQVGQQVLGLVNGAYAELVVAATEAWAELPPGLDPVDAGALPLVLLTGAQIVEEAIAARHGQVLLVTGALGSVGRVAVFVAKARGATVWAGVRRTQRAQAAELGADGVVGLDDEAELAALPVLDAIADTVGGETTTRLLTKLKPGGIIGSVVGEPAGAKERGLVVHAMLTHPDSKRLGELARSVAEGKLVIPIAKKLPLAEAGQAQLLAQKGAGGKVVLVV